MKIIVLTQGKSALVDDQDCAYLTQFSWHAVKVSASKYYAARTERTADDKIITTYMHRQIATRAGILKVDHWDGDGLNNQRWNLREATAAQNAQNKRKASGMTSRYKGVHWHSRNCNWHAGIVVSARRVHLGCFEREEDAALAYNDAAVTHFGDFALLNSI